MQQPFYIECSTLAIMSEERITAHHQDYYSQLIQDCVKQLKHKQTAYCFNEEQLSAIEKKVKIDYSFSNGTYTMWKV